MRFLKITDFYGRIYIINMGSICSFRIMTKEECHEYEGKAMLHMGGNNWITLSKESTEQLQRIFDNYNIES